MCRLPWKIITKVAAVAAGSAGVVAMATQNNVPRKQQVYAMCLAFLGVIGVCLRPSYASALGMCGMLLLAWREAFVPSPSSRLRISDIHGEYVNGNFGTSGTVKVVTIAGILLICVSIGFAVADAG